MPLSGWRERRPGFLYASTNREVEALNRLEQQRRRAARKAAGETIAGHDFQTVRGEVSLAAGERVQFYRTERAIGVATSEFGTARAVTAEAVEVVKDDGSVIRFDPRTYDQWGLGYSGTGYKGQGKTQPRTAAVYDNPYAWDARAAYVIGTRHRDDYRLFVSRDLAPDLEALAEQILRGRDDRGSSLRFVTADELQVRQEQRATAASTVLRAALGKSREVRAAKAAREREQQAADGEVVNQQAHDLLWQWNLLVKSYSMTLQRSGSGPRRLAETRAQLLAFGESLGGAAAAVRLLRESGADFGIKENSPLIRVLAADQPALVICKLMDSTEQRARERLQQRDAEVQEKPAGDAPVVWSAPRMRPAGAGSGGL